MRPQDIHNKRILFSPLNWGMGHVARSISLLIKLQGNNNELVIACDPDQQAVYSEYLSDVQFVSHEGYPFKFAGKGKFGWDLLKEAGALQKRLGAERDEVEQIIVAEQIDLIISDHRYGFRSDGIPSVFVTHQYNLPTKWYEKGVDVIHQRLLSKFDYIWIMDHPDSRLAGELSRSKDPKAIYIGPYSRFSLYNKIPETTSGKILIVSGPDIYGQQLIDAYEDEKLVVVCNDKLVLGPLHERKGRTWREMDQLIMNAELLISRSGYSTIMDLEVLNKEAVLIPTPGQAEQIYLAKKYGA